MDATEVSEAGHALVAELAAAIHIPAPAVETMELATGSSVAFVDVPSGLLRSARDWLRGRASGSGLFPVVLGDYDFDLDWGGTGRHIASVSETIDEADGLNLEGVLSQFRDKGREIGEWGGPESGEIQLQADPDTTWPPMTPYSQITSELGFPTDERIGLFPMAQGWEIAAHIEWGVGNHITPAEHLVMLRYFQSVCEAEVAAISGAACELLLPEPLTDRQAAWDLALILQGYADTVVPRESVLGVTEIASYLLCATVWALWWD